MSGGWQVFVWAFLVGGAICAVGQIIMDVTKLTPGHIMVILTVTGAVLGGLGWYEPLIRFAGGGATVPITSFGNALVQGAIQEAQTHGLVGMITGIFEVTSAGVSSAIVFAFIAALVARPKG